MRVKILLLILLLAFVPVGTADLSTDTPLYSNEWNIEMVNASSLWEYTRGEGIVVAVLDTGIDFNHPELRDKIWVNENEIENNGIDDDGNGYIDDYRGWNFLDDNNNPLDDSMDSHGTHVSGTVVGDQIGVAPNATIMPLKAFDSEGDASYEDVAEAIIYATDNGADIISMSMGGSLGDYDLQNAINYANYRGVLMTAAAGNAGRGALDYPARYGPVIAVGSVGSDAKRSTFSNYGSELELVAPGDAINSSSRINHGLYSVLRYNSTLIETNPFQFSMVTTNYQIRDIIDGGDGSDLNSLIADKIVLIKRGGMTFQDMASNVKNAGGYGMIVYNNEPGIFAGTLQTADLTRAVAISQEDGELILAGLESEGTIEIKLVSGNYSLNSGTSMATPHVSGILALLLSYNRTMDRGFSSSQLRELLHYSSYDGGFPGKDSSYGYGIINGERLLIQLQDLIMPEIEVSVIEEGINSFHTPYVKLAINTTDDNIITSITYAKIENGSVEKILKYDNNIMEAFLNITMTENLDYDEEIIIQVNATDWAYNTETTYFSYSSTAGIVTSETDSTVTSDDSTTPVMGLSIFSTSTMVLVFMRRKSR